MPVVGSSRRIASRRLEELAGKLLEASTLCAVATVAPGGRAYANTAYFAWSPTFELVWLSAAEARHSRNIRSNPSVAVSVYDSDQTWGQPDRGIQLFGSAREAHGRAAGAVEGVYASRFREFAAADFSDYRFYRFRPRQLKLFDERQLGGGLFVTAAVRAGGLHWVRTELYRR